MGGGRGIPRFMQRGQGKVRLSSLPAQNRSPFCPSHSDAVLSGSLAPEGSSLHNAHSAVLITAVDCEPIPHFSAATAFSPQGMENSWRARLCLSLSYLKGNSRACLLLRFSPCFTQGFPHSAQGLPIRQQTFLNPGTVSLTSFAQLRGQALARH